MQGGLVPAIIFESTFTFMHFIKRVIQPWPEWPKCQCATMLVVAICSLTATSFTMAAMVLFNIVSTIQSTWLTWALTVVS